MTLTGAACQKRKKEKQKKKYNMHTLTCKHTQLKYNLQETAPSLIGIFIRQLKDRYTGKPVLHLPTVKTGFAHSAFGSETAYSREHISNYVVVFARRCYNSRKRMKFISLHRETLSTFVGRNSVPLTDEKREGSILVCLALT